ncbi:MAG TPA: biotin/lipoyl-containing protein [Pyrinomonadaceae bacterium]|nr:biotin/lipoyl-containing protein [Pyrinomonadaceae bacterium]
MKLHAATADYETEVNISLVGDAVHAALEDRVYDLRLQRTGDRQLLLNLNGQIFDCQIEGELRSGAPVEVVVGTSRYSIVIHDPKRLPSATAAGMHTGGAARIAAPMPGKIVRILAEVGAQVEAGDPIVVVEAMKMQNEMKSPKAGKIMSINVALGATVNGGDVLAVIE